MIHAEIVTHLQRNCDHDLRYHLISWQQRPYKLQDDDIQYIGKP